MTPHDFSARINKLPKWARDYIHQVQTFVGAPEVEELTFLRDQNRALVELVKELKADAKAEKPKAVARDLALVLQRLYDSEINLTITWLWNGGVQFVLTSYMDWELIGTPLEYRKVLVTNQPRLERIGPDPWNEVRWRSELAEAIHKAAVAAFPESRYAREWGRVN